MLQLIRQGVGSLDEYAIIAPMRVLVVATPAAPAVTRLAPTLATLLAHGAEIHAHDPLSAELAREGIPHTPLNAAAFDANIRGLTAADLLIAPLGPGDVREPLAAVARALSLGVNTPLILVDPADAGDLIGALSLARGGGEADGAVGGVVGGAARDRLTQHAAYAVAAALAPAARGGWGFPRGRVPATARAWPAGAA